MCTNRRVSKLNLNHVLALQVDLLVFANVFQKRRIIGIWELDVVGFDHLVIHARAGIGGSRIYILKIRELSSSAFSSCRRAR